MLSSIDSMDYMHNKVSPYVKELTRLAPKTFVTFKKDMIKEELKTFHEQQKEIDQSIQQTTQNLFSAYDNLSKKLETIKQENQSRRNSVSSEGNFVVTRRKTISEQIDALLDGPETPKQRLKFRTVPSFTPLEPINIAVSDECFTIE